MNSLFKKLPGDPSGRLENVVDLVELLREQDRLRDVSFYELDPDKSIESIIVPGAALFDLDDSQIFVRNIVHLRDDRTVIELTSTTELVTGSLVWNPIAKLLEGSFQIENEEFVVVQHGERELGIYRWQIKPFRCALESIDAATSIESLQTLKATSCSPQSSFSGGSEPKMPLPNPQPNVTIDAVVLFTKAAEDLIKQKKKTITGIASDHFDDANKAFKTAKVQFQVSGIAKTVGGFDAKSYFQTVYINQLRTLWCCCFYPLQAGQFSSNIGLDKLVQAVQNGFSQAPVVVLFTVCGSDAHGQSKVYGTKDRCLSIVRLDGNLGPGQHVLTHELGHLFGCRHKNDSSNDPYVFGHAEVYSNNKSGTVMTTQSDYGSTYIRSNIFSSLDPTKCHNLNVVKLNAERISKL